MRHGTLFIIACLCILSFSSIASFAESETLTITTYYPSPYGAYRNLKIIPTYQIPDGPALTAGVIYYNKTDDNLRYFNQSGVWVNLTDKPPQTPNCHLVHYTSGYTLCPTGYYTWPALNASPSGEMLCCKVDNPG